MINKILISILFLLYLVISSNVMASISIIHTRHNLSTTHEIEGAPGENYLISGTPNVCVFCHTPHGSKKWAVVKVPLWNKGVGTTTGYSMYQDSPTLDTTIQGAPNGVSLACLSCHDGTTAMDTMINAPGSGWRVRSPGRAGRALDRKGNLYVWSNAVDKGRGLAYMPSDTVPNLGKDLSNDHPISMRYAGNVGNSGALDPMFFGALVVKNNKLAVVDNDIGGMYRSGAAVQNDGVASDGDIRLFNLNTGNGYEVQCASCHNPHGTGCGTDRSLLTADTEDCEASTGAYFTFLQRTNRESSLCRTCHIK